MFVVSLQSVSKERHITTSDSVVLYVNVKGHGEPCLFIHGGPGSGSYWLEKFSGAFLEQHFQMIYLDQRGVCRSTSPKNSDYSMDRMVMDFEEVRAALGIKRWITLGHSFGGVLQMGYAERCPQAIEGMIMLNCGLNLTERDNTWILKACEILGVSDTKEYVDDTVPIGQRLNRVFKELREKDLFWRLGYASKINKLRMDSTFAEIPNWNKDFERKAELGQEYMANYKTLTQEMTMPVLFFCGKTDWMVGPDHYKGVNFPNMILWPSDVGHVPFLENKADLEKAIESYIDKYGFKASGG